MSVNVEAFLAEWPANVRQIISGHDSHSPEPAYGVFDLVGFKAELVEAHIVDLQKFNSEVIPDPKTVDFFTLLWGLESGSNSADANFGWVLDDAGELSLIDDPWVSKEFSWSGSVDRTHYPMLAALTLIFEEFAYGIKDMNKVSSDVRFALEVEADAALVNLLRAELARASAQKLAAEDTSEAAQDAAKAARADLFTALWAY